MRRLTPALLVACALLAPAVPAAAAEPWERADESISCADDEGSRPFYNGPSASTVYDGTFALARAVPGPLLDGYVPQGLGTWRAWGGRGVDLLVQSAYNDTTDRAVIVGMVPGGATTRMPVLVRPGGRDPVDAHVGGVAVVGPWLFVAGEEVGGVPTVLRFPLDRVRERLADGRPLTAAAEHRLEVGTSGFNASFLAADGDGFWAGTFSQDARNRMYRFRVGPKGGPRLIGTSGSWIQVPKKTQGLAVTRTHFFFSTSYGSENRSNVYVVRRGRRDLDDAYPQDVTCFAAPSMAEGITLSRGRAFLSFESGSYKYRGDACDRGIFEGGCTRNEITHLHRASVRALQGMT
ncbi:hypothetical protein GKE82_09215 [Conexibacter sp. W3-3-2]|uniref:hypothetical protein n=1 Tax=Conexibacter sp. W3-3-2 TaxID=2675227 RepID=UPI0012B9816E|nr:hypothetical protein [Conexibacter sp. W3-3-2]MTD44465.1 hypothetical protein [Conexibacter sp. W3-3-2]